MCVAFKCVESGCYKCSTIKQYRISIHVYRPIHFLAGETPKRSYTFEKRKTGKKKRKAWVRWRVRRVRGVQELSLLCRLPRGRFGVNWPTHGNGFSLSVLLPAQHVLEWLTRYTHSCLSLFNFLTFSPSTFSVNLANTALTHFRLILRPSSVCLSALTCISSKD